MSKQQKVIGYNKAELTAMLKAGKDCIDGNMAQLNQRLELPQFKKKVESYKVKIAQLKKLTKLAGQLEAIANG